MQQDRRNERAANDIGTLDVEVIGIAGHKLGLRAQCLDVVQHIAALVEADNRTHPHVILLGVSDHAPSAASRSASITGSTYAIGVRTSGSPCISARP
jgi:hypothetical protein